MVSLRVGENPLRAGRRHPGCRPAGGLRRSAGALEAGRGGPLRRGRGRAARARGERGLARHVHARAREGASEAARASFGRRSRTTGSHEIADEGRRGRSPTRASEPGDRTDARRLERAPRDAGEGRRGARRDEEHLRRSRSASSPRSAASSTSATSSSTSLRARPSATSCCGRSCSASAGSSRTPRCAGASPRCRGRRSSTRSASGSASRSGSSRWSPAQLVNLLTLAAEIGGVAIALQLLSGLSYRALLVSSRSSRSGSCSG